eukprot:CAMPEP_0198314920 /NCGR_PEP_ID=MMETSP1450-20131203/5382_1 /TAXON_ID=753684 ORGANISM="Madagascaria erythrocladiodes, Strain CCMP3234" /NCGR_SAMPLE_ID=MMETSP1450 /ASSEMBLY_ACC=CAM_ASM_001115 /LENGTH=127 /DNA_ID=CAMNT_0044018005 /DNA_START=138 /DNA_END=521 /DNA_ORIENTATION=+
MLFNNKLPRRPRFFRLPATRSPPPTSRHPLWRQLANLSLESSVALAALGVAAVAATRMLLARGQGAPRRADDKSGSSPAVHHHGTLPHGRRVIAPTVSTSAGSSVQFMSCGDFSGSLMLNDLVHVRL